eukprot:213205-Chlamydomonas_euryale.AAC.1
MSATSSFLGHNMPLSKRLRRCGFPRCVFTMPADAAPVKRVSAQYRFKRLNSGGHTLDIDRCALYGGEAGASAAVAAVSRSAEWEEKVQTAGHA